MYATSLSTPTTATTATTSIDYNKFNGHFTKVFKAEAAKLDSHDPFKKDWMETIDVRIADLVKGILVRTNANGSLSYFTLPEAIQYDLYTYLVRPDPIPEAFFQKIMGCYAEGCYADEKKNPMKLYRYEGVNPLLLSFIKFYLQKVEILSKYSIVDSYFSDELGETKNGWFHLRISGTPEKTEMLASLFSGWVNAIYNSIATKILEVTKVLKMDKSTPGKPLVVCPIEPEIFSSVQQIRAAYPDEFNFLLNQMYKKNPWLVKVVNQILDFKTETAASAARPETATSAARPPQ
jgi:hypothetical protein